MPGGQSKCRSPSSWKRFVGETRGRDDKTQQMETWELEMPVVLDELGAMENLLPKLVGGFKDFYIHPYLGKIPNLTNIFQRG